MPYKKFFQYNLGFFGFSSLWNPANSIQFQLFFVQGSYLNLNSLNQLVNVDMIVRSELETL